MDQILICSSDPIFVKVLYDRLREDGFEVVTTDHTAHAVQMVFQKDYAAIILDSGCIGLSVEDAMEIMRREGRETPVILSGGRGSKGAAITVDKPLDVEEVRRAVQAVRQVTSSERSVGEL